MGTERKNKDEIAAFMDMYQANLSQDIPRPEVLKQTNRQFKAEFNKPGYSTYGSFKVMQSRYHKNQRRPNSE